MLDHDRGPIPTALAALVGALVVGGTPAWIVANILKSCQDPEEIAAIYGLVLCVRVRSPEQERQAQIFLREHGGRAICVHLKWRLSSARAIFP